MSHQAPEPLVTNTEVRPGTPISLKGRLCVMMFLQYFVQGCYLPIASVYVQDALGFSELQVGLFGSALAVGPILAPFLLGQLVDRLFATQRVLAACHMVAGLFMLALYFKAQSWESTQWEVWTIVILGTVYSVLYVPTMMLTNSLAFHHLRSRDKEFPFVRLFGTIGFIVPAYLIEFWWLSGLKGAELNTARGVAFVLSGMMGVVMGLYCLTLPSTPPERRSDRRYAPGVVLRMLKHRDFLVLVVISFFIAMVHKFFFVWNSPFLRSVLDSGGVKGAYEQSISSVGQICEIAVMAALGFAILRFGFKSVMLIGTLAYAARCLLFSLVFTLDPPFAGKLIMVITGQALHGLCFGCFLAAAYIYVDRAAPTDTRGSMQTVYGTCIIALGFFVGSLFAGWIGDVFTSDSVMATIRNQLHLSTDSLVEFTDKSGATRVRDWPAIWLSCALLAVLCVGAFMLLFPNKRPAPEDTPDGPDRDKTK